MVGSGAQFRCRLGGFLDNSKSLLGIAAGLGLAGHFRVPVRTRS